MPKPVKNGEVRRVVRDQRIRISYSVDMGSKRLTNAELLASDRSFRIAVLKAIREEMKLPVLVSL